jgi:hypothetical protein
VESYRLTSLRRESTQGDGSLQEVHHADLRHDRSRPGPSVSIAGGADASLRVTVTISAESPLRFSVGYADSPLERPAEAHARMVSRKALIGLTPSEVNQEQGSFVI